MEGLSLQEQIEQNYEKIQELLKRVEYNNLETNKDDRGNNNTTE